MFCVFKDGVFSECVGNIEFSSTVYQTAESLTPEQRELFCVYEVFEEYPDLQPHHCYMGQWSYRLENGALIRTWAQRPISESEKNAELSKKYEQLWNAADKYQASFISGVAIGLLTIGVLQQKPKALAVQAWSASIWDLYYSRKAALTYDGEVNTDFVVCGPMPHSVPELRQELGL